MIVIKLPSVYFWICQNHLIPLITKFCLKLEHYGICSIGLQWTKSYFSNCNNFPIQHDPLHLMFYQVWYSSGFDFRSIIFPTLYDRAHSAPLFLRLKVLYIFKVNTFHIARFMFLYHHQMLPATLLNLFVTNNQIH